MMETIMQVASTLEPSQRRLTGRPARCGAAGGAHLLRSSRRPARRRAGRCDGGCAATPSWAATAASSRTPASASSVASASMSMPCWTRRGKRSTRVLCRPCLDWSERRPHLAGAVGAALCTHSLDKKWVRRLSDTRAVEITPKGWRVFREEFGATSATPRQASRRRRCRAWHRAGHPRPCHRLPEG